MHNQDYWLPTVRGHRSRARRLTQAEVAACRGWLHDVADVVSPGQRRTLRYILVVTEESRLDWNRLAKREIRHHTGLSESGQDAALRALAREKRLLQARPTEEADGGSGPNEYRLPCLEPDDEKSDETAESSLAANAPGA